MSLTVKAITSTLLSGLLSPPGGIDQSHNNYESDASVTRGDSYLHNGDVWSVQIESFKNLYALQPDAATADYSQDVLITHRNTTLQYSIQNVSTPLWDTVVSNLTCITSEPLFLLFCVPRTRSLYSRTQLRPLLFRTCFCARRQKLELMTRRSQSNHSSEFPDGRLDQATLKCFFSITGDTVDTLKWVPGNERIRSFSPFFFFFVPQLKTLPQRQTGTMPPTLIHSLTW